jgi:hypothetical protein
VTSVTGTADQILASPTTGAVVLSLIGPYTPATYTAHSVLLGEGTSSIGTVGPTTTAGQILQSAGSTSDPTFSTATYPATTSLSQILYSSSANVVAGLATSDNGVLITGTTGIPSILAAGTTGQVLTATTGSPASWENPAASSISITGDIGTITGSSFTIYADNVAQNCGSSVLFSNSGTTSTLNVSDSNNNTILGAGAGNASLSGIRNCGYGYQSLLALTSGNFNCSYGYGSCVEFKSGLQNSAYGYGSLETLVTGSYNLSLGAFSGSLYTGSESSNILLMNPGVAGESNVMRLGSQGTGNGQVSTCYIAGITGVTTSSSAYVTINTTTGQLGEVAIPGTAISTIDGDTGSISGATVTIKAGVSTQNSGSSVEFVNSGTTSTLNVTDADGNTIIGNDAGNATLSGSDNNGFGTLALRSITSGSVNEAFGDRALSSLKTGSFNIAIGTDPGSSYTGAESSNILIQNSGVLGESNVMRLGTQGTGSGQVSTCYIAGITGVTTSSSAYVTINTTTGQLGEVTIPTPSSLTLTTITHTASPYSVLAADQFLACQTSGGTISILLPNAPSTGRVIIIKDSNGAAATSNISVTTVGGSVTIDGQTTYTIVSNYGSISVIFDGTNYEVF